jgi:hypothetical protein
VKKKKQLLFLAIAISTALLAARCAKPQTIYIDQETKDYCLFDVGSYWIFQDPATLKTDSIVIVDIKHDFMHGASTGYNNVETYVIQYACFYEDTSILMMKVIEDDGVYDISHLDSSVFFIKDSLIRFPYAFYLRYNKKYAYYPSYSICNTTYYEVKQWFYKPYLNPQQCECNVYLAKHIGFICCELAAENISMKRNLIRYNVKPYNK